MPNIFKVDSDYFIDLLKRKKQVILAADGSIITPEELEETGIENCHIDLHA
jgi:long-subunit acyl-CoA synthetase (AMP-forming)